jgi:peptidoglycan/xylan/chitin deacetylase (PgdA/CDA1 family)
VSSRAGETIVSLTFDDGWGSQFDAAAMLSARGMKGTFYVNTSRIGGERFLTWAQLEELEADGHEIGGHGLDHLDLTTLNKDELRRQVDDDRRGLISRGFPALSFAYPFGAYDRASEAIVRECGYASARAAWGLRNITSSDDRRGYAERVPPKRPFAVLTPCCIDWTTQSESLVSYVVAAENAGGGWVPFVLHRVEDDSSDTPAATITPRALEGFLDWLESRFGRGTRVDTVDRVVTTGRRSE